ncbi:hypothetical protein B0H11DRAFT_1918095 [Mycena galericulata]|nr:hypothetical protein B0H11DRAFT_1918095 [Mycena galericulata]
MTRFARNLDVPSSPPRAAEFVCTSWMYRRLHLAPPHACGRHPHRPAPRVHGRRRSRGGDPAARDQPEFVGRGVVGSGWGVVRDKPRERAWASSAGAGLHEVRTRDVCDGAVIEEERGVEECEEPAAREPRAPMSCWSEYARQLRKMGQTPWIRDERPGETWSGETWIITQVTPLIKSAMGPTRNTSDGVVEPGKVEMGFWEGGRSFRPRDLVENSLRSAYFSKILAQVTALNISTMETTWEGRDSGEGLGDLEVRFWCVLGYNVTRYVGGAFGCLPSRRAHLGPERPNSRVMQVQGPARKVGVEGGDTYTRANSNSS